MTVHASDCDCDAYACELRRKSITVQPGVARHTPRKGTPDTNDHYNQMNRGVAGEHRPGGGFMPYLKPDANGVLQQVGVKEGRERRHEIRETRRRQREQATTP